MTFPYSERVRQRLERRLWSVNAAATDMGIDRATLGQFRNPRLKGGPHGVALSTLDKIVAWLDEQDALDAEARR